MEVDNKEWNWMLRHFHGPAWRWTQAENLARGGTKQDSSTVDQHVLEICRYLRWREGHAEPGNPVPQEYVLLAAAEALNEDERLSQEAKILVIGGCPAEEIAARLKIDLAVLNVWERGFFDVRSSLAATDWIMTRVIFAELKQGNSELAARLKVAWSGGAVGARALLDAESRVLLRRGETLCDLRLCLHVKFQQAVEYPVRTEQEKLFFIKQHAELMDRQQRLRLAERRFQHQCEEALRKHALAEQRLAMRRQCQEEKATRAREREMERMQKHKERQPQERQHPDRLRTRAAARARQEQEVATEGIRTSALASLCWEFAAFSLVEEPLEHHAEVDQRRVA
jgi:hypothetical protein